MRLLFMCDLGKFMAGGGYAILKFAEYLAKKGHQVAVDGIHPKNKFLQDLDVDVFESIGCRPGFPRKFKGAGRIDDVLHYLYGIGPLRAKAVRGNFDIIMGSLRESAELAVYLAEKAGTKSGVFVYETPPWMEYDLGSLWFEEYRGRFKRSWDKTRQAYLQTDVLVSNSKLSQKWCEKWLKTKKVNGYVYPGVDPVPLGKSVKKKDQIVYIGRLNKFKNIEFAMEALSSLKNPPKLLIVGQGEDKKQMVAKAKSLGIQNEFLGRITDSEKWKLLKESRFMVFPSLHEGFGMPPMEALLMEIPCICSDKEVFREVYGNHVEYVKRGDVTGFAKKMKYLLDNPSYCKKKGIYGRKFVLSNFTWEKEAAKLEKLLKKGVKQ